MAFNEFSNQGVYSEQGQRMQIYLILILTFLTMNMA